MSAASVIKVILVIASQGYQPIEYSHTKKALEDAGIQVVTASNQSTAKASDNSTAHVNKIIDEINLDEYNGIFLIGGPGAMEHLNNKKIHNLMKQAQEKGLVFGAICISPRILAEAGIIKGKKATGWESKDNPVDIVFATHGVIHIKQGVVVDGKLVTADGPQSATEFGKAIVSVLKK